MNKFESNSSIIRTFTIPFHFISTRSLCLFFISSNIILVAALVFWIKFIFHPDFAYQIVKENGKNGNKMQKMLLNS